MTTDNDTGHIDVRYVADLAHLALTDDECDRFQQDLEAVLRYAEQLRELDVDGIEPTAHAAPMTNVMRDDVEAGSMSRDTVLGNAPETAAGAYVKVPVVIEGDEY